MIKLEIIGNLGQDAQLRTTQSGKNVIGFSVAHTEKYNDTSKTIWVSCSYFTDKTGIHPYLKKGVKVWVEGRPEVDVYEGNPKLKLIINRIELLSTTERTETREAEQQQEPEAHENDLPF